VSEFDVGHGPLNPTHSFTQVEHNANHRPNTQAVASWQRLGDGK